MAPPDLERTTDWPRIEPIVAILSFGSPAIGIGVMVFCAGLRILTRPALVGELEARSDSEVLREPLLGRYFGYLLVAAGALNIALSGGCAIFVMVPAMTRSAPEAPGLGGIAVLLGGIGIGLGVAFIRLGLRSIAVTRDRLKETDASSPGEGSQ